MNTEFITAKIDKELGNALARPPFTKDEFNLSYISLESVCQLNAGHYLSISKIYHQMKTNQIKSGKHFFK
jgi:hypothetical protein